MKLPRDLSGRQIVQGLCRDWGYRVVNQQGSHIILQTENPGINALLYRITPFFASAR